MHIIYVHSSKTQISNGLLNDNFLFTEYSQDYNLLLFLLITFLAVSVNSGPAEVIRPVRFWPDYIFTQTNKKKSLVGYDHCFTTWQRKLSNYSNDVANAPESISGRLKFQKF